MMIEGEKERARLINENEDRTWREVESYDNRSYDNDYAVAPLATYATAIVLGALII